MLTVKVSDVCCSLTPQRRMDVCYIAVPMVLVGIGSWIVADIVFDIYEGAIDTVFLCCCADTEMHDGVKTPYFMSKNLMVSEQEPHGQ